MDKELLLKNVIKLARMEMRGAGYEELLTPEAVDEALARRGTTLVMINSVCGCAGNTARPAAGEAVHLGKRPDYFVTVFAGQDKAATDQARTYFADYEPSSPGFALLKNGEILTMLERKDIEGATAIEVVFKLQAIFERYCETS